jgi:hypothetical protein
MLKTENTFIALKTATNNTLVGWGLFNSDDLGIGMNLYRNSSGVAEVYHTFNKNYAFGTSSLTLYTIPFISGVSRHTMTCSNMDINMDTNSTIYTNFLRNGNSGFIDTYNTRMRTNLNMNGFTLSNFTYPAVTLNTNQTIFGSAQLYGFLKINNTTQSGIIVYGTDSNSVIVENMNGEAAGFGANGSSDNFTIYTAGDSGSYCNF